MNDPYPYLALVLNAQLDYNVMPYETVTSELKIVYVIALMTLVRQVMIFQRYK